MNVLSLKLVLIESVWILVLWKDVVSMHSAMLKTIELSVLALQAIGQIQIHTQDVNNMNALVILNAQQTLHVQMRNVQILANVPEMLIVLQGTTEESVLASQDILEILMV